MKTNQVIENLIKGEQNMSYEDIYNALIREFFFSSGYLTEFMSKYPEINIEQLKSANVSIIGWDSDSGNLNAKFNLEIPEVYWLKPAPANCDSYVLSNNLAFYYFKSDGCHLNDYIIDSKEEVYGTGSGKYFYWSGSEERTVSSKDYPWKIELEVFVPEMEAYVFARLISAEVELAKTKSALVSLASRLQVMEEKMKELISKPSTVKPLFGSLIDSVYKTVPKEEFKEEKKVKGGEEKRPQASVINKGKTAELSADSNLPKKTKVSVQIDADGNIIQTEVVDQTKSELSAESKVEEQEQSKEASKEVSKEQGNGVEEPKDRKGILKRLFN